ncbi:DUF2345 domain-containing protein [Pseudomonas monteilii]|uniref:DUF2345 domain-containing protein n=1 Tax=Pseudomonas monteilii TaxID=76759 RepID=UPI002277237D|nr:DUF2345 domain-containing protein [Pseudomonas monteilii]
MGEALKAQHDAICGHRGNPQSNHFPELVDPQLVLASPTGIAATTPESTHIASGEHLGLSTGGHTSMAIGKRLLISASRGVRQFVQSMGWRLVAATGDIDLKALKDNINLLAKLKVSVTAERITLSAKEELVIQAGGSSTTYNASGILHATAGQYTGHATDFIYKGSKSQAAAFPEDVKAGNGNLELFQHYANNHAFKGAKYEVEDALGQIVKGTLDENGFAAISGLASGPVKVRFGRDQTKAVSAAPFAQQPSDQSTPLSPAAAMQEAVSQLIKSGEMDAHDAKRVFQSALKAPLTTVALSKELPLPTARTNQHG